MWSVSALDPDAWSGTSSNTEVLHSYAAISQDVLMTLIDGLVIPKLDDEAIGSMYAGGLDAAGYAAAIWQDIPDAFVEFGRVRRIIAQSRHGKVVRSVDDILGARGEGKVGIVLGWQNSDGFGANLELVPLYHEMGLRMLSIAFNFANASGSGCYEPSDGGLTAYGYDLVSLCDELGILLDMTHVGDRTAADAMLASTKPVCYTHAGARALQDNPRNKTNEQLRAVAETGGVIGVAAIRHYLPNELDATIEDYVEVVRHVLDVAGEDHVGLGTDMIPGQSSEFLGYTASRKGIGASSADYSTPPRLPGLSEFSDYNGLAERLSRSFAPSRVDKILGRNWLRIYGEAWG